MIDLFQMTSNEMKFALEVESVLNTIPEPEFRQLIVSKSVIILFREPWRQRAATTQPMCPFSYQPIFVIVLISDV